MVEKRRSPSPPAASADSHDSELQYRHAKKLHRDTSTDATAAAAISSTVDTGTAVTDAVALTPAWSQDSTVDMYEDTSSDTSMLVSTQDISMEHSSDEHEPPLAAATEATDMLDSDAIPQTPPPVTHTSALQSPTSRVGSSGPRMQLDPTGSAKMFHASSSATVATGRTSSLTTALACPTVTIHARLPILTDLERIVTPVQRDALGARWRVVWYPRGQSLDADTVSLFVEMGDDIDSSDAPTADGTAAAPRTVRVEFVLRRQPSDAVASPLPHERQELPVHTFTSQHRECGVHRFVTRSALLDPLNAFVTTDGVVEVDVHLHTVDANDSVESLASGSTTLFAAPPTSPTLHAMLPTDDSTTTTPTLSSYTPYDSKAATGMVGLKNQGATCYMNSLLQTLYHLRAFRHVVYATPTAAEDTHDSVSLALQRVFYRLQTQPRAVSTKELTRSFGWSQIDAFMQHDVQELYRILCDRLEEKMKQTAVDGALRQLFAGTVRSFVQCVRVDFASHRDESFYDLQLDVKGCRGLDDSFRKYVETELLEGENQYDANGHGKQDARKGLRFLALPPVLNIQLKRFEYDPMRDGMVKIHDRFEFPKTLVLDEFLSADDSVTDSVTDSVDTSDSTTSPTKPKFVYHLHSVLVHSGDVHGGHYYVFIRPAKDLARSNNWFRFDDDQITAVDEQTAIDGNFGSTAATSVVGGGGLDSEPSTPLYSAMQCSPERAGNAFRSADVIPDDDRPDDVYDYSRSGNGSEGVPTSLMLPHTRSFSSAYMLVYVRDGDNDIRSIAEPATPAQATEVASDAVTAVDASEASLPVVDGSMTAAATTAADDDLVVPAALVQRFQDEERAHARRKRLQQTEHLFMTVRVASDTSVAALRRVTKTLDFSSFSNAACLRLRIKRAASIAQLYTRIYQRTGVPVRRQRLWKVITRENRTHRPDALVDEREVDCVERLIDDDASPKAPIKLFLQILNDDALADYERIGSDDSGDDDDPMHGHRLSSSDPTVSKTCRHVIHRHLLSEFTPPEPPAAAGTDSSNNSEPTPLVDDSVVDPDDDDDELAPLAMRDANAALGSRIGPLRSAYDILLFIKWYDVSRPLGERLEYMGNIVVDSRITGAALANVLHVALQIPRSQALVLFEEVQPLQVALVDLATRLEAAEIQNGDIICYQFATVDDQIDSVDADNVDDSVDSVATADGSKHPERYPSVPQYFQYLLDRVDVVVRRYRRVTSNNSDDNDVNSDPDASSFTLELLYSMTYDEIVDAVARHLGVLPLFVRLYQHSPLSNQPKKHPLRHAKYAGTTRVTLDELLTEFTERTNVLYVEQLTHPITEVEAKRQVAVYFSIYGPTSGTCSLFVDPTTAASSSVASRRVEYLVAPTARVSNVLAQIRAAFAVPTDTALRVCAASHDGTRILEILDDDVALDAFSVASGYAASAERALFVEQIPDDELAAVADVAAARANAKAADGPIDEVDGENDDDDDDDAILRLSVAHFNFETNTHVYIHTHGVPFVVHFRLCETVQQVKERIRTRLGVTTDEFSRWHFAAVKELRASVVTDVYDDMDAATVDNFPMARLEEWCGARFSDIGGFGLEHADPKPVVFKHVMPRRQEQGIRIRQN